MQVCWPLFQSQADTQSIGSMVIFAKRCFTSQDIRFTTRGDSLYAIALAWPEHGSVTIKSLATDSGLFQRSIEKVELLGSNELLHWRRESSGLTVDLPGGRPCEYAFALRISSEKQN